MEQKYGFSGIPIASLGNKPREKGITMMKDDGLGLGATEDMLQTVGEYLDLAKLVTGTSALLPLKHLQKKISLYQEYDVEPFPGGMFLEYAHYQGKVKEFFEGCVEAGYRLLEVSDNALPFDDQTRERLVKTAGADYGLKVLGEVGNKHVCTDVKKLVTSIELCLQAGCWKVLVEAAELYVDGVFQEDLIAGIRENIPIEKIIFELPGEWIHDIHAHQVYTLKLWLMDKIGTDVNLANVEPKDILTTAALRAQIHANTLHKELE